MDHSHNPRKYPTATTATAGIASAEPSDPTRLVAGDKLVRMLICYLDESGNTGRKLDDPAQPFHTIAAVLVREDRIREMTDRLDELASRAPTVTELVEYHGSELFQGMGAWEGVFPRQRIAEYSKALSVLRQIDAGVFHSAIDKPRLAAAYPQPRPPHMYALQFLTEKLERWLRDQLIVSANGRCWLPTRTTKRNSTPSISSATCRQRAGRSGQVLGSTPNWIMSSTVSISPHRSGAEESS